MVRISGTTSDRVDDIDGFLKRLSKVSERAAALNSAWGKLNRGAALKNPKYASRFRGVIDSQLAQLSETKRSQLKEKISSLHHRSTRKANELDTIVTLIKDGKKAAAIGNIHAITRFESRPELDEFRFARFLNDNDFYKLWLRSDQSTQDQLAETFIEASHTWSSLTCISATYTDLAILYAWVDRNEDALKLLHRFRQEEPSAYSRLSREENCLGNGYFKTTIVQLLLGDNSEVDRDDYVTQFDASMLDISKLKVDFEIQTQNVMSSTAWLSNRQVLEKIAKLDRAIDATLYPESFGKLTEPTTIVDKKTGIFAIYKPSPVDAINIRLLHWAARAGDMEQSLALISEVYEGLKNMAQKGRPDQFEQSIRNQFFPYILVSSQVEEGFFWRAIKAKN